ncbi:MAG: phosphotransferase [Planctomycetota bacterium]
MSRVPWSGVWERWRRAAARAVGPRAMVYRLTHRCFSREPVYRGKATAWEAVKPDARHDFLWSGGTLPEPKAVFQALQWGGQMLITHPELERVLEVTRWFGTHEGFDVEAGPRSTGRQRWGLPCPLPGVGRALHYVVVRKVMLIEHDEDTDRFTFDVRLVKRPELGDRYVVMKQVPRYRRVVARLHSRFPEASQAVLLERAEKLVKRVFPVFLTREAGFLQLMNRDLPEPFKPRVPEALGFERAPDGTVKRLYMSWLRLGGEPLSQMGFAQQAAEMLSVLHDQVGVIHLDLRLDNIVISGGRVCFLDFGSSVRVGEDIHKSPLLSSLFDEMMNTSQIQRTMGKMRDAGRLTSDVLVAAQGKIDRGVDMFYLSLQISKPVSNPELLPLIRFDPGSPTAKRIKMLTDAILRPTNPNRPHFISARDVLVGLQKIERKLKKAGEAE